MVAGPSALWALRISDTLTMLIYISLAVVSIYASWTQIMVYDRSCCRKAKGEVCCGGKMCGMRWFYMKGRVESW
jgi:hypothetical protein